MHGSRTISRQPDRAEHKRKQRIAMISFLMIRMDEKNSCLCFFMPAPALSTASGRTAGFARGIEKDRACTGKGLS